MTVPTAVVAFGALYGVNFVALAIAAGGRARRLAALPVSLACVGLPFLLRADQIVTRGVLGLLSLVAFMRVIDMVRDPKPRSLGLRLCMLLSVFDVRRLGRAAPAVVPALFGKFVAYGMAAAAGFYLVVQVAPDAGAAQGLVRWFGGAVASYCALDAAEALLRFDYRLVGLVAEPLQEVPIVSRSLGEFWGRRWNNEVSRWLARHCFSPLARARLPRLGLYSAFVASAVLHGWPALVALGPRYSLMFGGFFLVQGALVALERPLRVTRWRPAAAHVWVLTTLVATSPLFVEPALRALGMPP